MELTNEQKQALETLRAAGLELPDELLKAVAGGENSPADVQSIIDGILGGSLQPTQQDSLGTTLNDILKNALGGSPQPTQQASPGTTLNDILKNTLGGSGLSPTTPTPSALDLGSILGGPQH